MERILRAHGILNDVMDAIKYKDLTVKDIVFRLKTEFPAEFAAATAAEPVAPTTTLMGWSSITVLPSASSAPVPAEPTVPPVPPVVTPVAAASSVGAAAMPPPTVTPTMRRGAPLKLPENTTPCPESIESPRVTSMASAERARLMNARVREADEADPYRSLGAIKPLAADAPARMQMDSVGRFGCKVCGEVHNIAKLHHEDLPCLEKNTRIIKTFLLEYDAAPNQRWRDLFIARENSTQTSFAMWERFLTIVMPSDRRGHDDSAWAQTLIARSVATEKSKFSIWAGTCKELFDRGEHLHYMSPASHLSHVSTRKLAERVENAGGVGSLPLSIQRVPKRARVADADAPVATAPVAVTSDAAVRQAALGLCDLGAVGTFGIMPCPDEYTNLM